MGYYATEHVRCKMEEKYQEWNADAISICLEGQKGWPIEYIIQKLKQEAKRFENIKSI